VAKRFDDHGVARGCLFCDLARDFGMLRLRSTTQFKSRLMILATMALVLPVLVVPVSAVRAEADAKPYDERLLRLAELMGAVHYLRELCSANDGQLWRERMAELVSSEGTSALRKAKLARMFNQGYRSYSRTYLSCTPSAQETISRFLTEGSQLADGLVKSSP
jgi:uncharacterized protein (TIGR02301 family)